MTLSNEIQIFLDSQIDYYTKESKSYKEMAKEYNLDDNSISDTTFGIIVGCVYSSFLQTFTNQNNIPDDPSDTAEDSGNQIEIEFEGPNGEIKKLLIDIQ